MTALREAVLDGPRLRLSRQLTPGEYARVREVLDALGGTWNRRANATIFPPHIDIRARLAAVIAAGRAPLPARTAHGYVATPSSVADLICGTPYTDLAFLPAGSPVLEPSAGTGGLVTAILAANPDVEVVAVEPDEERGTAIPDFGGQVSIHAVSFEAYAARAQHEDRRFAGIVMNPPFALPRAPALWVEHVLLAWELLRPGARLVAIVPRSIRYRTDQRHRTVRELAAHHGRLDDLPAAAFAASGTDVATSVLTLSRPLAAPHEAQYTWGPTDPGVPPVRVTEPRLTAEAVTAAPVQIWHDSWRRRDRLLYFRGQCIICHQLLWEFADGENDPRGALSDFSAGFSLHAADYAQTGLTVGLCPFCANTGSSFHTARSQADALWSGAAHQPEPADDDPTPALFELPPAPIAAPRRPASRTRR